MFLSCVSVHFLCALYKIDFIIRAKTFWSRQKYFSVGSQKIKFRHFWVLWRMNCFAVILSLDGNSLPMVLVYWQYIMALLASKEFIPFSDTLLFWTGMASHFCICAFTGFCLFVGQWCVEMCVCDFNGLFLEILGCHHAWPSWEFDFNSERWSSAFQIKILF